uniref:Uncharacterized protein n=1 Tax=Aegilops tauschii subsp. strangulata TaxID=200361 RepID=A0A453D831_AEGTS
RKSRRHVAHKSSPCLSRFSVTPRATRIKGRSRGRPQPPLSPASHRQKHNHTTPFRLPNQPNTFIASSPSPQRRANAGR